VEHPSFFTYCGEERGSLSSERIRHHD